MVLKVCFSIIQARFLKLGKFFFIPQNLFSKNQARFFESGKLFCHKFYCSIFRVRQSFFVPINLFAGYLKLDFSSYTNFFGPQNLFFNKSGSIFRGRKTFLSIFFLLDICSSVFRIRQHFLP